MTPSDSVIRQAFDETWRARRALAAAENAHRVAEAMLTQRSAELEDARNAVERADGRLQKMAAGEALPVDSDDPAPHRNDFVPTRRSF
jgi:hypothetical protein